MDDWRELLEKLPFLIALLAWLVSVALRNRRRGGSAEAGRATSMPGPLRRDRWPVPSTGGSEKPPKSSEKGYRPIEPR